MGILSVVWVGGAFWAGKSIARDSDTRDTDNKRYQRLKVPHKECLELVGRWVRAQDSMRILSVA